MQNLSNAFSNGSLEDNTSSNSHNSLGIDSNSNISKEFELFAIDMN